MKKNVAFLFAICDEVNEPPSVRATQTSLTSINLTNQNEQNPEVGGTLGRISQSDSSILHGGRNFKYSSQRNPILGRNS